MIASTDNKMASPPGGECAPGAEPLALCMSCNATFSPQTAECPNCHVGLSVVRKCPACQRIQSAQHFVCIYCANSFLREAGLGPSTPGPVSLPRRVSGRPVYAGLAAAVALGAISSLVLYKQRREARKPEMPMGQSYVLRATSLRQNPSLSAPPIKDFQPPEIVDIMDLTIDEEGNRWFRISSQDLSGYLLTQEIAPPKATDPEKGFALLRHSLLGLNDPAVLTEATAAVENYRKAFPESPHADEVTWLLAERARDLAEHAVQRQAILRGARKQYGEVARGSGEFAMRARQALAQLPAEGPRHKPRSSGTSAPLQFSVVGGLATSPRLTPSASPTTPVRSLTVVSRTPLSVRLTKPVEVYPGVAFQGEIERDIRVNDEIAVPKGSLSRLTIVGVSTPSDGTRTPPSAIQLAALVIDHQTYGVSAVAVRIEPPAKSRLSPPGSKLPPQLLAGTRVLFRLSSPLVITHP